VDLFSLHLQVLRWRLIFEIDRIKPEKPEEEEPDAPLDRCPPPMDLAVEEDDDDDIEDRRRARIGFR